MSPSSSSLCAICAESDGTAQLIFRREGGGGDQPWAHLGESARRQLCGACTRWVGDTFHQRSRAGHVDASPGGKSASSCDFCIAAFGSNAYVVDLVPDTGQYVRKFVFHHAGRVRQYRLCLGCWTWCRAVVFDDAAARGVSNRLVEGPAGSLLATAVMDICGGFLSAGDAATARAAASSIGVTFTAAKAHAARRFGRRDGLLLLSAGASDRAAGLVESLPADVRRHVAIVARSDALSDARAALQAGAGDLLTSPLTMHQVVGALDRAAAQRPSTQPTSPGECGLPPNSYEPAGWPYAGQRIAVDLKRGEDLFESAWLLRRFLRGYDRIGTAPGGGLEAIIYCPPEHLRFVIARVSDLLDGVARVTPVGTVAAGASSRAA